MSSSNEIATFLTNEDIDVTFVKKFIENNDKTFNFSSLDANNGRKRLLEKLFTYLRSDDVKAQSIYKDCLIAIRILCRDKRDLDNLLDLIDLDLLTKFAAFNEAENILKYDLETEALKCLCNIIYNSPVASVHCSKNGILEIVIERLKCYKKLKNLPIDVKLFDMRILFLITALCDETRSKVKEDLRGLKYLKETLESLTNQNNANEEDTSISVEKYLSKDEANFVCEVLKVLFNLTVSQNGYSQPDEEDESHYKELVKILRDLLTIVVEDVNAKFELTNNVVNLMTNMPTTTFPHLYKPIKVGELIPEKLQFNGQDMRAVYEILNLLKYKFSSDITIKNQPEVLSPILTVLVKGVNSDRYLRKYLRQRILPPLTDVHSRPEEGDTLRNNLCRLLTSPMTNVRDLAADLVFILCKENVARMIKYTGYGNAAGLFANRGLLGGGRPGENRYSSESEDSDTEEYREHKHGINPVIGCFETPKPNPMANMTEEQKEYEAMKLVDLMDNLTRTGVIQPCKIGEDGRPQPIEHVLQLQEGLPAQQIRRNQGDE